MRRTSKISILVATVAALSVLFSGLALADNVQVNVAENSDGDKIVTVTAGGTGATVDYRVKKEQDPNEPANDTCNLSSSNQLTLTPNVPSGISKSPTSLSFSSCNSWAGVTFSAGSSVAAGDYAITASMSGASGSFQNDAAFTLRVVSSTTDSTAPVITPTITGTRGNNGWYTSNVTVSWTVVDNESTASPASCASTTISTDTAGQTVSCSSTSAGGTTNESVTITRDASAPNAPSVSVSPAANAAGWNNTDVAVDFTDGTDNGPSGIANCTGDDTINTNTTATGVTRTGTCTDNAGNVSSGTETRVIKLDKSAPNAPTASALPAANSAGWNNTNVEVAFAANGDNGHSGVASCSDGETVSSETSGTTRNGTCTDDAGNVSASAETRTIKIDKTAPTDIRFDGPQDGGSYLRNFVPTASNCTANFDISGEKSCTFTGGGNSGSVTATATDNADNSDSVTRNYTVRTLLLKGFYSPVDMGGVLNSAKSGSTVPLKFEVLDGSTERRDTAVVKSFNHAAVSCDAVDGTADEIEVYSTGGTSLRFDTTGDQFVQNWQTPKGRAGYCYRVTMTTVDDSSIVAYFKLK